MKKHFFISVAVATSFIPMFVSAQVATSSATITSSSTTPTSSQVFTACSQMSIDRRDTAIAAARLTYNGKMVEALTARKEAEKSAVALLDIDVDGNKDATKNAIESYRKAVQSAQENLVAARTVAWNNFEKDTQGCRETSKEIKTMGTSNASEKKLEAKDSSVEWKKMKTVQQMKEGETKTLRENLLIQLDSFFSLFGKK